MYDYSVEVYLNSNYVSHDIYTAANEAELRKAIINHYGIENLHAYRIIKVWTNEEYYRNWFAEMFPDEVTVNF